MYFAVVHCEIHCYVISVMNGDRQYSCRRFRNSIDMRYRFF